MDQPDTPSPPKRPPGRTPDLVLAAALPAILCSLLLMRLGHAPTGLLVQQGVIGILVLGAAGWSARFGAATARPVARWPLWAMVACIWWPWLGAQAGTHAGADAGEPSRWVGLFGFRLYVAAVILPTFLVWLLRVWADSARVPMAALLATGAVALGLWMQPDAPQLLALAVGCVPVLWLSGPPLAVRVLLLVLLFLAAAGAWSVPVALEPVSYVEGVFRLAAAQGLVALAVAMLVAVLPCAVLALIAHRQQRLDVLGACAYFAALLLMAPRELAPVPLLGFGAGPILGYGLLAAVLTRGGMARPGAALRLDGSAQPRDPGA